MKRSALAIREVTIPYLPTGEGNSGGGGFQFKLG
jgi:hypothetical protein